MQQKEKYQKEKLKETVKVKKSIEWVNPEEILDQSELKILQF